MDGLRYNKIVIATDADVDGMHIRLLLMTFFLQFFPDLVKNDHLYILQTPLFRVRNKKETIYCYSDEERQRAIAKLGKSAEITRFKGLGEISPDEFKHFIGPDIRLEPVMITKDAKVHDLLGFYMGKNTPEPPGVHHRQPEGGEGPGGGESFHTGLGKALWRGLPLIFTVGFGLKGISDRKAHDQAFEDLHTLRDSYATINSPSTIAGLKGVAIPDAQAELDATRRRMTTSFALCGIGALATVYGFIRAGKLTYPQYEDKEKVRFEGLAWVPTANGGMYLAQIRVPIR
jgi:hypothetical protein